MHFIHISFKRISVFLLIYLLLAGLLIAVSIANGVLTILKVLIIDFFLDALASLDFKLSVTQ